MPPSTATCTIPPRLTVVTRYSVQAVVATMLRPGSTMMRLPSGSRARAWPTIASAYASRLGGCSS